MPAAQKQVFVTGATGYVGRRLIQVLLARGHRVKALTRAASTARVPPGAAIVVGNALDAGSLAPQLDANDTVVHLVGTPHPSPAKAAEFRRVDLASIRATVAAASSVGIAHLVYVSVAHPAPVMQSYIEVRQAGEKAIVDAQLTATVLRPWYILGPGHWWPVVLLPVYALGKLLPPFRSSFQRLDLIPLRRFVAALVFAVENPPAAKSVRVLDAQDIKRHD